MNDEVCQGVVRWYKPCGRQVYRDKKCIFHLENKSDEEAKIFEIAFWKELEKMEKDDDTKELDFTGFIFQKLINFYQHLFEKPVNFSGAKFNNIANFSDAHFKELVDFTKTQFNNKADFSGAQFNNIAKFSDAKFRETSFRGVQFQEASFYGVQFNNETDFNDAKFNNEVYFSLAQIGKAYFQYTQFNNKAYFTRTTFNNIATFELSEFQDTVFFIDVKFPSNGEDVIFLKNVKFHKPKDVRFQNIDLSNVSFLNTDISEVEFLDAIWTRKLGRLAVIDETRIGKDAMTTYGAVAQLYRRLRQNYETNYRFSEAGDFFIGEMEMRRLDVNTNIKNEKIKNYVLWFKRNLSLLSFYKHLSLYGESYLLPVIWAIIVIVSYPMLINWLFNASLPQSDDFLYTYLRTSSASFFQMESNYIGERIIGALLLGLLFISLKRQFERKK